MLKRQKINQVLKIIMETGQWHGYIVACKVNEWHINHGWHIGCAESFVKSELIQEHDRRTSWLMNSDSLNEKQKVLSMLKDIQQEYEYYNCNYELGYYAVFYQEV